MLTFNVGDVVKVKYTDNVFPGRVGMITHTTDNLLAKNVYFVICTVKFKLNKMYQDHFTNGIYEYYENQLELISRKGETTMTDKFNVGDIVYISGVITKIRDFDDTTTYYTICYDKKNNRCSDYMEKYLVGTKHNEKNITTIVDKFQVGAKVISKNNNTGTIVSKCDDVVHVLAANNLIYHYTIDELVIDNLEKLSPEDIKEIDAAVYDLCSVINGGKEKGSIHARITALYKKWHNKQ